MDLQIHDKWFLVGGATSGFGLAITEALIAEGAKVIAIARSADALNALLLKHPTALEMIAADITEAAAIEKIIAQLQHKTLHGVVINAGGPPAKTTLETTLEDWDEAYKKILRWKVGLTQALVPAMIQNGYGRFVFIESASVKQPLENLVLSTAFRMAVVGMVKTLSQEIAHHGITLNVMAPGSHDTPAINRIYHKKCAQTGVDFAQVKATAIEQIPVGFLGQAQDFASLALWLLSPQSRFVTGQVYALDGGTIKSSL